MQATFCPVAQQFYPVDASEYTDAEIAILNAVDELESVDELPGWDEDGDIMTVVSVLKEIQAVLDEHWLVIDGLDLNYQKLTEQVRSHLAPLEITDVDSEGKVIVIGYCNPYLGDPSESGDDEF